MSDTGLKTDHLDAIGPTADPYVGKMLGRYRVVRLLGGGGMGSVYEAEHTLIGRRVALKLLHAQFASDPDVVRRFMNEARAAAMLGHPHILESTDMGQAEDGAPFLVLELLEGKDLGDELERVGVMPVARAARIIRQIASALSAAHEKGIVHRDLKPDNVFLTKKGDDEDFVKVLDFGISKFTSGMLTGPATASGSVMGTPQYMAPEQVKDASKVDARADVYALGAILYQCLTGRMPFQADTLPQLFLMIMGDEAEPIASYRRDVPDGLVDLVERAMAKEPDDRVPSMDVFIDELKIFESFEASAERVSSAEIGHLETLATPASKRRDDVSVAEVEARVVEPTPSVVEVPANRWGLWAAAVVVVCVLTAAAVAALNGGDETAETVADETHSTPPPDETEAPEPEVDVGTTPDEPEERPPTGHVALAVSSPDGSARVMFRGETHDVPYAGTVSSGTTPELIEVSAPRRRAMRFWVTLDETRSLWVDLERGNGSARATGAQLEAALRGTPGAPSRSENVGGQSSRRRRSGRHVVEEPPTAPSPEPTPPAPAPTPVARPEPAPRPDPTPPRRDVYDGPSGAIPDSI